MSQKLFTTLSAKVSLIPEEGVARKWVIDPENFKDELGQIAAERPVEAVGRLYRAGTTIYFDGEVDAAIRLDCSRCLETFSFGVSGKVSAVFMPEAEGKGEGPEKQLRADDLDVQFYDGDEIDLLPPIRDYVAFEIPMRPLCADDCNGLCPECGLNLNKTKCSCEKQQVDSRFSALKKLITREE
ncbi:hypothetical protein MNBD_NITROSPINAE04-598 [hydrothermal vent metagenome]|uniref:COG1399 protein, clustered with ribosomal protein L32p n=1 Tax=hydrothermal vent metagenome TaxID=652676 RepID=A0A3B1CJL1_9ZZZZ